MCLLSQLLLDFCRCITFQLGSVVNYEDLIGVDDYDLLIARTTI